MADYIKGHAFACPKCRGRMRVITSRKMINRVIRYRECTACLVRVRTEEAVATGPIKRQPGPSSSNLPTAARPQTSPAA